MSDVEINNDLYDKLNKLVLETKARRDVVDAGADVTAEVLQQNTPIAIPDENPFDNTDKYNARMSAWHSEEHEPGYLKDHVTYKSGQYPDDSTDVGFDNFGYYGRFVNDGHALVDNLHHPRGKGDKRNYASRNPELVVGYVEGKFFMEKTREEAVNAAKTAMVNAYYKNIKGAKK